jgi:hypothetical protein
MTFSMASRFLAAPVLLGAYSLVGLAFYLVCSPLLLRFSGSTGAWLWAASAVAFVFLFGRWEDHVVGVWLGLVGRLRPLPD